LNGGHFSYYLNEFDTLEFVGRLVRARRASLMGYAMDGDCKNYEVDRQLNDEY